MSLATWEAGTGRMKEANLSNTVSSVSKKGGGENGEMAQGLRALAVLTEDLRLVTSTHTAQMGHDGPYL